MSKTYVLIHGTWHGGWAWQEVIGCLSGRNHRAHAPTLAGHGPEATRSGITHRDCVASVVTYIQNRRLSDVILVGHSFGGTVVQKVVEEIPDQISRIVFLDALVLADNQCVFDNLPAQYVALFNNLAGESSDNSMFIPWEIWRDNFMQDAPESSARAIWE